MVGSEFVAHSVTAYTAGLNYPNGLSEPKISHSRMENAHLKS